MSKEFIDNEIDEAHHRIKEGDYEGAVNQLKNIKLRIHEPELLNDIKEFENEHDKALEERIKTIEGSNKHHFDKHNEQISQISKYAKSYLRFYDKLRKEHEIY